MIETLRILNTIGAFLIILYYGKLFFSLLQYKAGKKLVAARLLLLSIAFTVFFVHLLVLQTRFGSVIGFESGTTHFLANLRLLLEQIAFGAIAFLIDRIRSSRM